MKHTISLTDIILVVYNLLACLYLSPIEIPFKLAFPLIFLTLCALRLSSWPIILAMGFSALGDWMGVCHNFWGQMGAFALAHVAYIIFFGRTCRKGMTWNAGIVALYGIVVGALIVPHVQGVLQVGVSVYILLIMTMCILAGMQKNLLYTWGAWLFVLSDTVLAWNKFVSPIESAGYFIMIPYYLGQLTLFIQSLNTQKTSD